MSKLYVGENYVALNEAAATGKTTQARLLAHAAGAQLLLGNESLQPEIVSGEVYTQGSSAEVEKWFVNFHVGKLATLASLPREGMVSDMSLPNDLVWARALLREPALREFEDYYLEQSERTYTPDIAILLLLPPQVLLERIKQRLISEPNRAFEAKTTEQFIDRIQCSFIDSAEVLGKNVATVDLRDEPYAPVEEAQCQIQESVSRLQALS
jgi:deoxyadenosine/deoxycytidine kinase